MKNVILIFTLAISLMACKKKNVDPEKDGQIGRVLSAQKLGCPTCDIPLAGGKFYIHGQWYENNTWITDQFVIGDSICYINPDINHKIVYFVTDEGGGINEGYYTFPDWSGVGMDTSMIGWWDTSGNPTGRKVIFEGDSIIMYL